MTSGPAQSREDDAMNDPLSLESYPARVREKLRYA